MLHGSIREPTLASCIASKAKTVERSVEVPVARHQLGRVMAHIAPDTVQPTLDVRKQFCRPPTPVTDDPLALLEVKGVVAVPNLSSFSHFHRHSTSPYNDTILFDPVYSQ